MHCRRQQRHLAAAGRNTTSANENGDVEYDSDEEEGKRAAQRTLFLNLKPTSPLSW
jgi:hypothetical protein